MNHLTHHEAREQRLRAGVRLSDVAYNAKCAQATVRSYEFGAPVRPLILARLHDAYALLCGATSTSDTTPPSAT